MSKRSKQEARERGPLRELVRCPSSGAAVKTRQEGLNCPNPNCTATWHGMWVAVPEHWQQMYPKPRAPHTKNK